MKAGSFYQNYREVRLLVVHCSTTRCDRDFSVEALRCCHLQRGFAGIGYHFYITRVLMQRLNIQKSNGYLDVIRS